MSKAQAQGYANLPEYRLTPQDLREYFTAQEEKVFIEIGFGNGEVIAQFAKKNPNWQCLGIDVYRPGIGALVNRCTRSELRNVRIVEEEATTVLELIPNDKVDLLYVLFPDPWPKQRHHRRRLVNAEFAALVDLKISATGIVYMATDARDYADQIRSVMSDAFYRIEIKQIEPIPQSRYRQKALDAGQSIWDLAYMRSRN
ncbi:MAG: tRNA (guanosine(46)-N7)-methyltransferase TrmB [Gammaproteobacteria bacterium]|nr:tRNA (guanosine(46)-N7)-methyltransferase TrmB [Gammaproteobacteria bacterium]